MIKGTLEFRKEHLFEAIKAYIHNMPGVTLDPKGKVYLLGTENLPETIMCADVLIDEVAPTTAGSMFDVPGGTAWYLRHTKAPRPVSIHEPLIAEERPR